jgi:hypothetical protein
MSRPLALLIGLVLIFGGPIAAQAEPQARPEADAPVQVLATRTADGIALRYSLPAPVDGFEFADHDTIRTLWTVTTPGLTLADGTVTGSAPFSTFDLRLVPDAAEVDRIYPGLTRIGDGVVLYGPGLKASKGATVLTFDPVPGQVSLPPTDAIDGYAYFGPEAQVVADPRGDVATGANVDAELAGSLRRTFFDSMDFYGQQLGLPLTFRPALLASVDSPGPSTFRGDVTDTGVISVRFQGDGWRSTGDQLTTFVWHEAFHLWNGHGVHNRDADTAPWLHEGGADYAALVGAVSSGDLTEAQARTRLSQQTNRCRAVLGSADGAAGPLRSGNGPYVCGTLIQWLADLELRHAGTGDVFTLWKTVLSAARDTPTGYGITDFRAALVPDSAVLVLLDGPGTDRWRTIKDRLTALGVTLEDRPGDDDLRAAALFHVAQENCKSGSYGFYNNPGALTLDGADCGVLSGEPIIDTVEGFTPQTEVPAMFAAVQARCAVGDTVHYVTRDGRTLEAVCGTPLPTPSVWTVTDAPSLAVEDPPITPA